MLMFGFKNLNKQMNGKLDSKAKQMTMGKVLKY